MKWLFLGVVSSFCVLAACKKSDTPTKEDPLKAGLIAHYPFNGNGQDESGNGALLVNHDAVLVGDRFGKPAQAYGFDGLKSFMTIPALPKADSLRELTISVWVKPEARQEASIISLLTKIGQLTCGSSLNLSTGSGSLQTYHRMLYYSQLNICNAAVIRGSAGNPLGEWTHLVLVQQYNTSDVSFPYNNYSNYVNGVKTVSRSESKPQASDFRFGGRIGCNNSFGDDQYNFDYTKGSIDDIRIYNRALSEAEVTQLFKMDH